MISQYFILTMTTPQRYQTFVERSITPSGMGIEIYFVLDSQTNERVAKCRNQAEVTCCCLENSLQSLSATTIAGWAWGYRSVITRYGWYWVVIRHFAANERPPYCVVG